MAWKLGENTHPISMHSPARLKDTPSLPVLGWQALGRSFTGQTPSVLDNRHRVFTSSGSAAIYLALQHLGVKPGDKVLVPTYHCPSMISPIARLGGVPLFFPITTSGAPDLEFLERAVPHSAKAILVAHYFGLPQAMRAIRAHCDRHGICLIEDCAHAMFGRSDDRTVGQWGDLAIASLSKFFPVPEGGVLVSAQAPLRLPRLQPASMLREIRTVVDIIELGATFGRLQGLNSVLQLIFSLKRRLRDPTTGGARSPGQAEERPARFEFDDVLAQSRPAWITRQMPRLTEHTRIVKRRRHNYQRLARELTGHEGFAPLFPSLPDEAVPYVFPLNVSAPEEKYRELRRLSLPVFRWDWLWSGARGVDNDIGQRWSTSVFQLACHQDLTDSEIDHIRDTILRVCGA